MDEISGSKLSELVHQEADFLFSLVDRANATTEFIAGLPPKKQAGEIKKLVEGNDVVLGIWTDENEELGFDWAIIKGAGVLERVKYSKISETKRTTAIAVSCIEDALALREAFAGPKTFN